MKFKDSFIILSVIAAMMGLGIYRSVRENSKNTEDFKITKVESESDNLISSQTTEKNINSESDAVSSKTSKSKTKSSSKTTKSSEDNTLIRININTADYDTLMKLNKIGDSLANEIIAYRNEHGDFKNIEELLNVPGIGEKIFNSIKDNIYVENPIYDLEDDLQLYININTATHEELVKLYKIGDILADEIIIYRETNGPFNNIEEIMNVPGISEGIFSFIWENIYVENPYYPENNIDISETPTEISVTQPYDPINIPSAVTLDDVAPIELNSADIELLKLLPHVGDEEAMDIVNLREEIVVFSNVYELLYVESLTDEQVIDILPYVYIEPVQ